MVTGKKGGADRSITTDTYKHTVYVAQKAALLTDQHAREHHLEDDVVQLPELGAAVVFFGRIFLGGLAECVCVRRRKRRNKNVAIAAETKDKPHSHAA